MAATDAPERLVSLRRDLHRHPEPAWREFYTTCRLVEAVRDVGVDALHVGREALAGDERGAVPDDDELATWYERARRAGADEETLRLLEGGYTGLVAELHRGDGPTVALRVDIDALPREESDDEDHLPAAEGFRSENEGAMHACGHDAHAAIGVGVLSAVAESDFTGTLKVLFQPAEEVVGGGRPLAESGHLDGVDYLLAVHVGLDHPTGTVVAGVDGFLAVSHLDVSFTGEASHAGGKPNEGRNAAQALATAVSNLYSIPRHEDGATRVNAGRLAAGTAANIVPEHAEFEGEVRGETTALRDYTMERAREVIHGAAATHGCEATIDTGATAPGAESDDALAAVVRDAGARTAGVEEVLDRDELGGSEDATYLMRTVQEAGGLAAYVVVGTDHPGGHHSATFDVDEASIPVGVDVLSSAVEDLGERRP